VFGYKLVFKDIRNCHPEAWKALTCMVALKPCNHKHNHVHVCRSDCISLLDSCLDQSKMERYVSAQRVCKKLLPNDNQKGCLSVHSYEKPPTKTDVIDAGKLRDRCW
jgi:reversion-inducing cysteine-rich kazal motif protein